MSPSFSSRLDMSYQIKNTINGVLLCSLLLSVSSVARADSYQWVGPDDGAWNNAANWAPAGIPGAKDNVTIGSKKKISVPYDTTVANLTVGAGAEVKNGGKIKVTEKTNSTGLFTGIGTLDVPVGATATFNVDTSSDLAATSGSTAPAVVFAPINNRGRIITKVAQGCRVDFASVQNQGSTQVISDGTVTFKDIKNTQNLTVSATGTLTLAKIDNAKGASISISATTPLTPLLTRDKGGNKDNLDPSVVHLDSLTNNSGGKVKLSGDKGGRYFDGKSIDNAGDIQISGAQTMLDGDVNNSEGATLTLDSDATLFAADKKVPKVNNSGKIIKSAGSDATLNVEWNNKGQVVVEDGTLHVRIPQGKKSIQTEGITTFEGGVLSFEDAVTNKKGTFTVQGGVVDGIGTIEGDVVNAGGTFKPGHSPGTITINGNFTQTSGGVLNMEVGGTTPGTAYDQILVNGTAFLGGTLNLVRWNGYVPHDGDVYTMFTYYAKVGSFARFVDATPVAGVSYDTTLTPTTYEVNCSTTTTTADTTPPVVSIASPIDGRGVRTLTIANGAASDNVAVAGVTGRLYRYTDPVTGVAAGYWAGGTSWTPTPGAANEKLANGTTAWTFPLPGLAAGRYTLRATATDSAGNIAYSHINSFWVDPNPPSLTIDTPASGATISTLTTLGGAVSDAAGGSGLASFQGQLRRLADGLYWNGTTWSTSPFSFSLIVSGARWSRSANLPGGTNLRSGAYSATATATDRAGNTQTVTSKFAVSSTVPSTKGS